jgi:primary-amine oxidase
MSVTVAVTHPLDPLTAEEISAAVGAVRAAQPLERPTFSLVVLQDPPKAEVVGFAPGDPIARRARVVVTDRATRRTFEGIVDLATRELASWVELEGIMPPIVEEDFICAAEAALADERFVAALRRRGIEDLGQVQVDPLAAGSFPQNPPGRRIVWATPYLKPHPLANAYSSPIEHLRASVDLDTGEVIDVLDHDPIVPISTADGDYETEEAVGGWRDDVAPLEIVQPEGPGFTIEGHVLRWQDWRLHVAPHPVDGLVLSDLRFRDGDEERQVLYRASLSEMVVPYGDPHDGFYWRTYFDGGEYGMGRLANSLELGCDCLGEIRYLDSVVPDAAGEPRTITNAVCIHEEDAGVLWKHTELSGAAHVRRSRRLVVSFFTTIGNYDYGFYWSLYQDGSIELEAKATGIVLTRGVTPDQEVIHGARLAPDLAAPHHQHLFNARLDMAVDGFENTVHEVDMVAADAGPENPYNQAIVTRRTPIRRESEGRRHIDPASARTWHVVAPGRRNHVGEPTAYKLVPFNGPTMLASPESSVGRRAGFAHANLWVTRFSPDELHAAGEHPNQHAGGAGLPEWMAKDRPLEGTDVVLWHTFGISHEVRPEEWPVMPVERIGFALKPVGFFARNPALRVPPSEAKGHCG